MQGTSGFEHDVRAYMRKEMTPLVDEVQQDGLGGIFGIRHHENANAPRVMVAAHMDEVGFMITQITDRGLFKVTSLGGWNPYVVSAQRFTLKTAKGEKQLLKFTVLHFGDEEMLNYSIDNKTYTGLPVKNGFQVFEIPVELVTTPTIIKIKAGIGQHFQLEKTVQLRPVREMEIDLVRWAELAERMESAGQNAGAAS